jgi:hypothetical protein
MSHEAAALNASVLQNVMSTLASLCSCLRARPHSEQTTPYEREVGTLLNACEDEPEQVRRFVASQVARGWWV